MIEGFLLLDTGACTRMVAETPLDLYWKMKALDVAARAGEESRARMLRLGRQPSIGSVWLVDAEVLAPQGVARAVKAPARRPAQGARPHPLTVVAGVALAGQALARLGRAAASPRCDRARAAGPGAAVAEDAPAAAPFRLRLCGIHALERVALERSGPRLLDTLDVKSLLPAFGPEPR